MNAVIFDWDGVVIDSSDLHEQSWELLAKEIGKPLPAGHFKAGFGKKNQEIIPTILRWAEDPQDVIRLADRKEELYRKLVREQGVHVLPGARELLSALRDAAIPRAIGSSTPRSNLDAIFASTGLDQFFDAVVSGDDVKNGKPAPDVFLLAAERLSVSPERCVVLEDAHVGIEAAHRAGMKVVAVATTHPIGELTAADAAVRSLMEVTPDFLTRLLADSE